MEKVCLVFDFKNEKSIESFLSFHQRMDFGHFIHLFFNEYIYYILFIWDLVFVYLNDINEINITITVYYD